ncbi:MAG: futalosine hydrolase [Planctomycetota bacterium]|nr:futalosine hydrolase [Planctomycetota bacterium]
MRLLILTAVDRETRAIEGGKDALVIAGGVGRTNAAASTTHAILRAGPFDAVISAGLAGALPGSGLNVGDTIVASSCIYAEEGLLTPTGFADLASIGLSLGDFDGNAVPVDDALLDVLSASFRIGPVATVATCSGTDDAAATIARRTDALAEAMEGAAVVHAARRLDVPAIELRAISNLTGDRSAQQWDFPAALQALGEAAGRAIRLIGESGLYGLG